MTRPTLHILCPHCAERLDVLQALAEGELREYLEVLAGFGPAARPVVEAYLGLFRALPGGAMRVATRLRLVRELAHLWADGLFAFDRRTYKVTRDQITTSLHEVVRAKRDGAGIVNHNYLKKVMVDKLDQVERGERRQQAKAHAGREADLRAGQRKPAPARGSAALGTTPG